MREVASVADPRSSGGAPTLDTAGGVSLSTAGQTLTGQRVCIHGVQTRTELNGTYGRAIAFHAERGRYAVELEGSREHVQTCSGGRPGVYTWARARQIVIVSIGAQSQARPTLIVCATLDL